MWQLDGKTPPTPMLCVQLSLPHNSSCHALMCHTVFCNACGSGYGMVTEELLDRGSVLVKVPRRLLMTLLTAQASPDYGELIVSAGLNEWQVSDLLNSLLCLSTQIPAAPHHHRRQQNARQVHEQHRVRKRITPSQNGKCGKGLGG